MSAGSGAGKTAAMDDFSRPNPETGIPRVLKCNFPPVFPTIKETLTDYLQLERLPIHHLQNTLKHIKSKRDPSTLLDVHDTQLPFVQQVRRDPRTGKIIGFEEVEVNFKGETAKNSFSLTRNPGPKNEGLRGSSTNYPFWPGGFDEEEELRKAAKMLTLNSEESKEELYARLFEKDLLWIPPGFETGVKFSDETTASFKLEDSAVVDIGKINDPEPLFDFWQGRDKKNLEMDYEPVSNKSARKESSIRRFLKELPDENFISQPRDMDMPPPVLKISQVEGSMQQPTSLQWAEVIDVTRPMDDFKDRVPTMAFQYSFELDTFQKQAIALLEEHENVFVAAHTSAGKTVVAEYAIALSEKHMTRAVYTSPIKALSNQKFRDFKNSFGSVGLVTGDVQINSTASCLIMTTEILRSMLYNGSDVIRDIEYVIFDEIHYLNNEERGHVWEEVLIMLPSHVTIIMLSATVPNALQFANWVGGIKQKKIYVISTPKRPVPLEHYLYTGSGSDSKNERYLLLDSEGKFLPRGFAQAKDSVTKRMSNYSKSYGPRGGGPHNPAQEKTRFITLVNHLKENDKLPVVVFVFSRNRCDEYARMLQNSNNLTDKTQQKEIHGFFQKSIARLKGTDRELPQVLEMQQFLKSGIGVHHSGILPILKEIVEMLFQRGLVKLLFATETFAMGVNMPARTVVFDGFRKHDGTGYRHLNPSEYIQMAGRAGRRGLDTTGTVIILCKQNVPDESDLRQMMTGKATKLESQFRVTYSMILNLFRVESLTVEDVMKRSFLEASSPRMNIDTIKKQLKTKEEFLYSIKDIERDAELITFYHDVHELLSLRASLRNFFENTKRINNELRPGRLVVVEQYPWISCRFGIILAVAVEKIGNWTKKKYDVLILKSAEDMDETRLRQDLLSENPSYAMYLQCMDSDGNSPRNGFRAIDRTYQQFLYYSHNSFINFIPPVITNSSYPLHGKIRVDSENILDICEVSYRIDVAVVLNDLSKRSIPRFMHDPPAINVVKVLELLFNAHFNPQMNVFNPIQDMQFDDAKVMTKLLRYLHLKQSVKSRNMAVRCTFCETFMEIFCYLQLQAEKNKLEFLLSPNSLRLHEEYQNRVKVLHEMAYINNENLVELKGRVACEMGNQNELMITELVFHNSLSECSPEEIAALLSCMVTEARNVQEPSLKDEKHLAEKVAEIKETARKIGEVQRKNGLQEPVEQYVEQFKFGLVLVIYEWAKGKPFAEIMKLTEAQEGLIVRTIQRLDELLRDVKDASRIIGDPSLKKKMEDASNCIKRDIVFAASLYTQ